jgi:23S rRNA A2030 N6-methylase RlmJ
MPNKQLDNVGNLGDILKHGALVRLAKLMSTKAIKAPLLYFDTHAFMLNAPWNNTLKWKQAVNQELSEHPYYKDYVRLEAQRLDRDEPYRCSAGLVIDVINDIPHRVYLAEKDDETRQKLQEQVRSEPIRCDAIVDEAKKLADIVPPGGDDFEYEKKDVAVFALIDPFELDHAEWAEISSVIADFTAEDSYGVIQVFDYDADADQPQWPEPPENFYGPVATLDRGPYHNAVYASRKMVDQVQDALELLGWHLYEIEVVEPEE